MTVCSQRWTTEAFSFLLRVSASASPADNGTWSYLRPWGAYRQQSRTPLGRLGLPYGLGLILKLPWSGMSWLPVAADHLSQVASHYPQSPGRPSRHGLSKGCRPQRSELTFSWWNPSLLETPWGTEYILVRHPCLCQKNLFGQFGPNHAEHDNDDQKICRPMAPVCHKASGYAKGSSGGYCWMLWWCRQNWWIVSSNIWHIVRWNRRSRIWTPLLGEPNNDSFSALVWDPPRPPAHIEENRKAFDHHIASRLPADPALSPSATCMTRSSWAITPSKSYKVSGSGWFRTSLKCSTQHWSYSAWVRRSFPAWSLTGLLKDLHVP